MIIVRPAKPIDADTAIDVVRQSIHQSCMADHCNDDETLAIWLSNKTPQNFLSWLSNIDNYCVIAESSSHLLGVGSLHRRGEILLFYLAPSAQHLGIGKLIHSALEEKAVLWGLTSLQLESTALARRFYESLGYRSTGPAIRRFGILQCFPYRKQLRPSNSF
jgi:GNAT superfamily N-acetyltransferase